MSVGILEAVHAPPCLGPVTSVHLLPAQHESREDHSVTFFFLDHTRRQKTAFARRQQDYPRTEKEFSQQWARLSRRDRKRSMFLAFTVVEVSSRLPWLLNCHRCFSFRRDPPSVPVTLHRHPIVSRRSFLGHAHVDSLSSLKCRLRQLHWSKVARMSLRRGGRCSIPRLMTYARLGIFPRGSAVESRSVDASWVSRWIGSQTLRSLGSISMSVLSEVATSASGGAWVSGLVLCDAAL